MTSIMAEFEVKPTTTPTERREITFPVYVLNDDCSDQDQWWSLHRFDQPVQHPNGVVVLRQTTITRRGGLSARPDDWTYEITVQKASLGELTRAGGYLNTTYTYGPSTKEDFDDALADFMKRLAA